MNVQLSGESGNQVNSLLLKLQELENIDRSPAILGDMSEEEYKRTLGDAIVVLQETVPYSCRGGCSRVLATILPRNDYLATVTL